MEGFKPKQEKRKDDWEAEGDVHGGGDTETNKKGNSIGYALAFGAGLAAGGFATEKVSDYSAAEQAGKNWSETFNPQAQLTQEEIDELKGYEVVLASGEKTRVTLEQAEPTRVNLEEAEPTRVTLEQVEPTHVDLTGSEQFEINPENPHSNPTEVELEAEKKVQVNPNNPHSKPVQIILKGSERVRVNPVNPHSEKVRVDPVNPDSKPTRVIL